MKSTPAPHRPAESAKVERRTTRPERPAQASARVSSQAASDFAEDESALLEPFDDELLFPQPANADTAISAATAKVNTLDVFFIIFFSPLSELIIFTSLVRL